MSLLQDAKLAQTYTNFVILLPILSEEYSIQNFTLRKETIEQRSSIRFEIHIGERLLRIKQFFYDWAIPVITADTNLVKQGIPFEINGIVGFIGTDYKGNQAACFSRWFTNIELSVLSGHFADEEIVMILKSLTAVEDRYISISGEQSFTTCSYTSRFNKSKWGIDDEISRVQWYQFDPSIVSDKISPLKIQVPKEHDGYFGDSIGYSVSGTQKEFHFLYRSKEDYTNGFWLWIAPKDLSDPLPTTMGRNIGVRQSWHIKKMKGSIFNIPVEDIIICRQNTTFKGWMVHWEMNNYIYHLYFRANTQNNMRKIISFLKRIYAE